MKTTLKTVSIIAIVLGVFAILGSEGDGYAIVGGLLFLGQGSLSLAYIASVEKK